MTAEIYQTRLSQFQAILTQRDKQIRYLSWARVITAVTFIAFTYFGFQQAFFFIPAALLVVVFFVFVRQQIKREEEQKVLQKLIALNQAELLAERGDHSFFADGEKFNDPHHAYCFDLDLFGKGSLFQYLNRCATALGEKKMSEELLEPCFSKSEILVRQEAIRELAKAIDFRQKSWAIGKVINDAHFTISDLYRWLSETDLFFAKKFFEIIRWLLPTITIGALLLSYFVSQAGPLFVLLMIIQLTITSIYSKEITQLQVRLSHYRAMLENYSRLFFLMKDHVWTTAWLTQHQQRAQSAAEAVKGLSALVNALESRQNAFARFFGNGLFLYDFHAVIKLEKWKHRYASELSSWMNSLATWDALQSYAALHFREPGYSFATITDELNIQGEQVGHPLISSKERINNPVNLGSPEQVMLITGANMAGKSTYLRTVGVNYILAAIGSPVCARAWQSPLAALRSGMRTSDSLQDHQSYFFAELNRLQSIIQDLKAGRPLVILLDEILKGTNSTDKQAGSRQLIKQLLSYRSLVFLATHDVALGDMQEEYPGRIVNQCFEGQIESDQLIFDYTLHKGVAQKANATFLMQKMGIIPPIG